MVKDRDAKETEPVAEERMTPLLVIVPLRASAHNWASEAI
jgi:hypothetical protein